MGARRKSSQYQIVFQNHNSARRVAVNLHRMKSPVKKMRARATCCLKFDANDAHVIYPSRHQKRRPWKLTAACKCDRRNLPIFRFTGSNVSHNLTNSNHINISNPFKSWNENNNNNNNLFFLNKVNSNSMELDQQIVRVSLFQITYLNPISNLRAKHLVAIANGRESGR